MGEHWLCSGYMAVGTGCLVVKTIFHFGRTFYLLSVHAFTDVQEQSAGLGIHCHHHVLALIFQALKLQTVTWSGTEEWIISPEWRSHVFLVVRAVQSAILKSVYNENKKVGWLWVPKAVIFWYFHHSTVCTKIEIVNCLVLLAVQILASWEEEAFRG